MGGVPDGTWGTVLRVVDKQRLEVQFDLLTGQGKPAPGEAIEIRNSWNKRWFPGKMLEVNKDGTYTVQFVTTARYHGCDDKMAKSPSDIRFRPIRTVYYPSQVLEYPRWLKPRTK